MAGGLAESEVELEAVEPRDVRVDLFFGQFVGQCFVMAAEQFGARAL